MLKTVHIKNVRSCADVLLTDLPRLFVLVGRNGVGKSNIMRAIDWAARSALSTKAVEPIDASDLLSPPPRNAEVIFDFEQNSIVYRYQLVFDRRMRVAGNTPHMRPSLKEALSFSGGGRWYPIFERANETISISGKQELQVGAAIPSLPAIVSLLPQEDDVIAKLQPVIQFLRSVHYYPFDEPNVIHGVGGGGLIRNAEYTQWLNDHNRETDPSSPVLMRLVHMSLHDRDKLEELKELLGQNGLGILRNIDVQQYDFPVVDQAPTASQSEQANRFYLVSFFPMNEPKGARSYMGVSFGTRRLLRVVVSLLFDKNSVMLIEQPEDGIHPGLLHKLIPMLKSYSDFGQVVLASHSAAIFNRLQPHEIRLVDSVDGSTTVRALTPEEIEGAERFISEDGPLSDYIETVQGGD